MKKFKKNILINFLIITTFITYINNKLYAHELWLEPDYNSKNNHINIMIGQNFNGTPFGFSNADMKQLFLENKNNLQKIIQRDGNFPAIQINIDTNKFNIINYETNYSFLEYDSFDDFEKFVKNQNSSYLIKNIDKTIIPKENYKRFSKILISNSNNFFIQKENLDYEIVALNSPFDPRNEFFEFRLLENNKPLKNLQLLDIGCGGGLLSEPMSRLGANVVGIDASLNNIKVAKHHLKKSKLNIKYLNY